MTVALGASQVEACRRAIVPVEVILCSDVAEACAKMATVLPLVVAVDEAISEEDRAALAEFTTACGAEIVLIEAAPPAQALAIRILDAVTVAERRRFAVKT